MLPELSDQDRTWYILKGYNITINCYDAREWRLNSKLYHREDGPAYESASGSRHWFLNGERHREDGPAIEWADGTREWYLNGIPMTEEEHRKAVQKMKIQNGTA